MLNSKLEFYILYFKCVEELIFKLEEDVMLNHGEKKIRRFERAPRPNRLSTHVS